MAGSIWLRPFSFGPVRRFARSIVQAARRSKRFVRDTSGVAAVEFALLAPPFFMVLFSMFEIGTTYLAGGSLQDAANETARMVRTGQVSMSGMSAAQFRAEVCDRLFEPFMPCDDRLKVDVRRYTSFAGGGNPSPLDGAGNWNGDFRYEPGGACDIVLVRLFYQWTPVTPGLSDFMLDMAGGTGHLLEASAAVRNEPFAGGGC